ncbi:MAG: disulfide bond formation protein DsbA [Actinobacteria bacterium]|nr:disulfide bond formation protein DsbA [Actinomycetota bacterium]
MTSEIEIYADIWCPFAHVGLRCAREQRDGSGRDDVILRVHPWPLELVNSAPMDPAKTSAHIEHLRHQIDDSLFAGFDASNFPTSTIDALALIERAYGVDGRTGEAATFAVRDALFERGLDISDPEVLASLAADLGITPADDADRAAVTASWQTGQAKGVKGSPHFFCGTADLFCPSLDITRGDDGDVTIDLNIERLGSFMDLCLS